MSIEPKEHFTIFLWVVEWILVNRLVVEKRGKFGNFDPKKVSLFENFDPKKASLFENFDPKNVIKT
jgi:hypothetical protein